MQLTRAFDFTGYKRTTLERRIQRRMAVVGITDYAAYLELLEARPEEFSDLFNTILINVTGFFRDRDVWDVLETEALPRILAEKDGGAPIRVWSAGGSSGQEAYTIAMVVANLLGLEAASRRLKVFATDVDDEALKEARRATYGADDLTSLPDGFRDAYFEPTGGRFKIRRELRNPVIFGRHDLIHDVPISRIDLLACRNTIMYFNAETQKHIHVRLHFAMAPSGVLVLGKAEMPLSRPELFSALDLKRRVFVKSSSDVPAERIRVRVMPKVEQPPDAGLTRLRHHAFDASPVAQIAVDASGVVAQINAQARATFGLTEHDQGRLLQDLEISYRPVELRSVLEQAYAQGSAVLLKDVERRQAGEPLYYDVQVTPLTDRETGVTIGAEISFVDVTQATRLQQRLRRTNEELQEAFEQLQSTSEELETTNEELLSTNEELETTNEELQSTNEELETMNEELQATNESQHALNQEVRHRSDELLNANLSLEAILATLRSAVVVIDRDLQVKGWSARAEDLWGMRTDEVKGKNLMTLDIGLPVEKLGPQIRACFAGEPAKEVVLQATNRRGRPIECKVACLRLADGSDEAHGVVLVIAETSTAS